MLCWRRSAVWPRSRLLFRPRKMRCVGPYRLPPSTTTTAHNGRSPHVPHHNRCSHHASTNGYGHASHADDAHLQANAAALNELQQQKQAQDIALAEALARPAQAVPSPATKGSFEDAWQLEIVQVGRPVRNSREG